MNPRLRRPISESSLPLFERSSETSRNRVSSVAHGYPLQQKSHYKTAYAKAKEVKESKAFSLYKDVHDLADASKRNKEEAIYTAQYNKKSGGSPMHTVFLPYYAGWDSEQIAENQAFGGAIVPSATFIGTYDDGDAGLVDEHLLGTDPEAFVLVFFIDIA